MSRAAPRGSWPLAVRRSAPDTADSSLFMKPGRPCLLRANAALAQLERGGVVTGCDYTRLSLSRAPLQTEQTDEPRSGVRGDRSLDIPSSAPLIIHSVRPIDRTERHARRRRGSLKASGRRGSLNL